MSRASLPRELCDLVVDYLHADRASLGSCALVCRAWVPASRFHLFEYISLTEHEARAAARLNDLLASPHASFARAVRSLNFYGALSPVQIRRARRGPMVGNSNIQVKTLLEIAPRVAQLTHIRTLGLSDLPFELLPAFRKVETLYLIGITAGSALLRLATCLPTLTRMTLTRVHAIPYRAQALSPDPAAELKALHCLRVRGSSIAFLGWLAVLAPCTRELDLGDVCPSEMPYLTQFVRQLEGSLESLELGLSQGADVREFAWDELAEVLGTGTRLVVCIDVGSGESQSAEEEDEEQERDSSVLRAQFPELEERGMLEVQRLTGKRVS